MDIEWQNTEEQKNKTLEEVVGKNTELKNWLVEYVGNKKEPEDGNVTVDMIVNTVADEFPEFLLAVAEENWIRGYEQALTDVDVGKNIAEEKNDK
tara:strand:- start:9793 stop:10077 length:285 start_codon:yes stop_codon:yes gene_type:complete